MEDLIRLTSRCFTLLKLEGIISEEEYAEAMKDEDKVLGFTDLVSSKITEKRTINDNNN